MTKGEFKKKKRKQAKKAKKWAEKLRFGSAYTPAYKEIIELCDLVEAVAHKLHKANHSWGVPGE